MPQTVALTATGAPAGATVAFNPASITAGQNSTATITTSATTPAGNYPITITGTGTSRHPRHQPHPDRHRTTATG